jgi:DNA-binding beta-propeller fold protein YncE
MTCATLFKRSIVFVISTTAVVTVAVAMSAKAQDARTASNYTIRTLPLPDNGTGDVSMDYIAFDPATNSLWVPGGNTGAVDVVDIGTDKVRQIPNLPTSQVQARGGTRVLGPSGVSVGDGIVYIGNRGGSEVCAFNARSLARIGCAHLDSSPDGVAYVAPTKEVWVTTPGEQSIRVLDASTLTQKAKLTFPGNPEGYAVDAKRGRFYTNLEDKDRTVAIDLKTHETVATWNPACGGGGPHGLGLDEAAGHLFIGCDALAEVMNVGGDGAVLSKVDTGDGVDDINYAPATHLLYVGAARAAKLTIARADASGKLTTVAQVPTQNGARNGVVTKGGTVYLAHGGGVRLPALLVVSPAK